MSTMSSDEQSEEEVVPLFRPFTRESLAAIEARIAEAEARKKETAQKKEEGGVIDEEHFGTYQQEVLEPDPLLEAGLPLPKYLEREFPAELIATPIEDLDKFYENKRTFVVISRGKDIFRFSATNALWILGPFNPIRRAAIGILVHPAFSFLVIVTILVNCVLMTQNDISDAETESIIEKVFTAIYTVESCIKAVARGFILEQFTYLRDPWNWLDFIVITLAYFTMVCDVGKFGALRTFRVLRALKTVAVIPGLKTIVGAVIESVKNLKDVIILTVFSLSIFALLGLQMYMGVLMQKCVRTPPENSTDFEIEAFINNETNWMKDRLGEYYICGNASGARICPRNFSCMPGVGPNPNHGYTNFDTFYWALLASFRLMTQDFWESLYQMVLRTAGPWHMCFFILIIFLGSFYLLNLILAIVAMSYDELQRKAEEEEEAAALEEAEYQQKQEAKQLLEERAQEQRAGGGIVKSPSYSSCKSYELFVGQVSEEKERASIKSVDGESTGDQKSQINGKVRKASLSLPGSPFNPRKGSRGSQFCVSWRNGRRYGDRKPLVLQTFMDAQEHLPYADDSKAVTPMSEEDGAIVIPIYTSLNSRHSSYTSHLSRISYTSHGDMYGRGLTKESQLKSRSRNLHGHYSQDSLDDDECVITKNKPHYSPYADPQRQTELELKDVMVLNQIIDQAAGHQSGESGREREPEEKLKLKERCMAYCLRFIDIFCVWDCCACWCFVQKIVAFIVFDPFMELFITLAIVVNTLFMSMEHANMDEQFQEFLKNGNYFFTAAFAVEAGLKLIALSPKYYFKEGWNVFDFFIVALSLVELSGESVALPGLSVLRSFRLLRVFKLAKSWPTLNLLISIMGKTVGALGNLTFVLGIIIFIFAVMGMQLFGEKYGENKSVFPEQAIPRWNFCDFLHSFMIVFRVLCGEWIESMWDCMLVADWPCIPFFLSTVLIGYLVVLNLFLALLLSSFGASNLSQASPESADTKKLQEAFDRIGRAINWVKRCIFRVLKALKPKARNQIADQTTDIRDDLEDIGIGADILIDGQVIMKDIKSPKEHTDLEVVLGDGLEISIQGNGQAIPVKMSNSTKTLVNSTAKVELKDKEKFKEKDNKEKDEGYGNKVHPQKEEDVLSDKSVNSIKDIKDISGKGISVTKPSKEGSNISLPDASQEEKKDASKEDIKDMKLHEDEIASGDDEEAIDADKIETEATDVILPEYPADCFPEKCYKQFPWCMGDDEKLMWQRWNTLRSKCYALVENKYFETLVITMILVSSLALAAEDVNLKYRSWLEHLLRHMDKTFTILFFFEMLLKWLAFGFQKYFTNAWCWLDFVIVLVSMINLLATLAFGGNIPALKTMRTLRALRPLRALSRSQGMRVVVNALVQAIPAIFNVLLVCLIFWLIFSIMGVQLFAGKFYSCIDSEGNRFNSSFVPNRTVCKKNNFTWHNPQINFDNVLNAYLSLFQVATFKGWTQIMNNAIDTKQTDDQPEYEVNRYMYLYFVLFIIIGSFFTLNLFIGVIIDNFNEQKKKAGGSLEMFMTEDQKKYYNAMKKMGSKKPAKAIPRPRWKLQCLVFDLITNQKFDVAIMLFIGLNMLTMAMDHYHPSATFNDVLERLNLFFIAIFTAECVLKMFALRWYFFKEPWNVFDFVIVILSVLSVAIKDMIQDIFVSPTMLRVVRVVKIGRVLRLVKGARGIRTLLFALAMSLPALFNICLLLFLVMFIYAIFGMSFFMNVKHREGIDENFNFETFGQSMIILFQMSTSAGWSDVLAGIMDETDCSKEPFNKTNDCYRKEYCTEVEEVEGDCGSRTIAVAYLISYLIISFLIIINMYIAVILENYSQATEEVQEGLTDDDYDMYYDIWQKYDPEGTQFIKYEVLTDFIDALEEPLQIKKPNKYKIISMDICICEGDLVFCVDILDALTKDFFITKGISVDETEIADVAAPKERGGLQPISSTLRRQREEYASRVIQQAWRHYRGRTSEEPRQQQQTAILVESDGHVTKNGHKVVIHSRSPSITSRSTDV